MYVCSSTLQQSFLLPRSLHMHGNRKMHNVHDIRLCSMYSYYMHRYANLTCFFSFFNPLVFLPVYGIDRTNHILKHEIILVENVLHCILCHSVIDFDANYNSIKFVDLSASIIATKHIVCNNKTEKSLQNGNKNHKIERASTHIVYRIMRGCAHSRVCNRVNLFV